MKISDCWNCEYLFFKSKRAYCLWYRLHRTDMKWGRIVPVKRVTKCRKEEKQ